MREHKIRSILNKIIIICIIVGISLGIFRHFKYLAIFGSTLDGLWTFVFSIALYNISHKYIYMFIPIILGILFELTQLFFNIYFPDFGGNYYPGVADFNDVVFYIIGSLLAVLLVYLLNKYVKK